MKKFLNLCANGFSEARIRDMILITGDVHGDIGRFSDKRLRELKKGDTLIVCGDLGLIWNGSDREKRLLKKLGR